MEEAKQKIFVEHISFLYSTNYSYDKIGRHIKSVKEFLESDCSINTRGYKEFIKANALKIANSLISTDAIRLLLNRKGMTYKKTESNVKPLEKLSVISERNLKLWNDFVYYMTQEDDYSECTIRIYSDAIKKYFEYANDVSADSFKRFVKMLESKGFAPQTIRLRITALEKFSKWMKKPIELKRPKFKRALDTNNVPTEQDYNKLLEYLKTKKNGDHYFFIKILATTGARVSEFLQFKWEDILNGEVTLKGKGNKYRRFFFNQQLQDEVKEYVSNNNKAGYVAVGRYGRITQRGLSENMKAWGENCGIEKEKMHPHAFRHFFAKMYLKKNNDVIQLADLLGHGSIDTTRIYLQKSYDEQKREFNQNVTW